MEKGGCTSILVVYMYHLHLATHICTTRPTGEVGTGHRFRCRSWGAAYSRLSARISLSLSLSVCVCVSAQSMAPTLAAHSSSTPDMLEHPTSLSEAQRIDIREARRARSTADDKPAGTTASKERLSAFASDPTVLHYLSDVPPPARVPPARFIQAHANKQFIRELEMRQPPTPRSRRDALQHTFGAVDFSGRPSGPPQMLAGKPHPRPATASSATVIAEEPRRIRRSTPPVPSHVIASPSIASSPRGGGVHNHVRANIVAAALTPRRRPSSATAGGAPPASAPLHTLSPQQQQRPPSAGAWKISRFERVAPRVFS